MPKPFPDLQGSLPDGGFWSAEFESYDMRMDAAYFFVTRSDDREFFVRVGASNGKPDEADLYKQVSAHAEAGTANTDYTGSMMWRMRRKRAQSN